jgi:cysteine desulfurase
MSLLSHFRKEKRIFLDYASATPMRKESIRAMEEYLDGDFYNPSSIYKEGAGVKNALEEMRKGVARAVHAGGKDVVFTSGGTESDNLAIFGVYEALKEKVSKPHIITLDTEHPAILEAVYESERRGAEITVVETTNGMITAEEIMKHVKETTVLVTLSYVNGEVGTILPVGRIVRELRQYKKQNRKKQGDTYPYLHVDASQALTTMAIHVDTLGADLLTLDSGKIYGPKGVGALIVRPGVEIKAQMLGGGQERGKRSGTENVAGIAGFVKALELLETEREKDIHKITECRDLFIQGVEELREKIPEIKINGGEECAPHIVSITIPGKLHEFVAIQLDRKGILVSTGSSCSARKNEEDKEALRFSFGKYTTETKIKTAIRTLKGILL